MNRGEQLPSSWCEAGLGEVAEIIQGQSPPGSSYNTQGRGLPFFQGKAEFGDLTPTASKWCTKPSKIAEPDDVLISIRAPVGPTNLSDSTCCIGRGLAAITPAGGTPPKYLLYALRATEHELASKGTGTTFKAIGGKHLREHRIAVAPAREQHRIVEAIESYLTRLDNAVASLERVRANLKRYRASVLKAAVEGRLVPTEAELARKEGHDYEPADKLLRCSLSEAPARRRRAGRLWGSGAVPDLTLEERSRLPEGWVWTRVKMLGRTPEETVQVGPMSMRSADFEDSGVPVLNVGAVQWDSFDQTKLDFLPAEKAEKFGRYQIQAGDVLFTRSGTVGRCAVAPSHHQGWLMTFHLLRARVVPERCQPEYLRIVFEGAEHIRRQRRAAAIGSTRAGFNTRLLADLDVPLPPAAEQRRIVAEVQRRLSLVTEVGSSASTDHQRITRLRESILRWAFQGKLVDQDPNDEPASVLLERIKAERATEKPTRRSRKDRKANAA